MSQKVLLLSITCACLLLFMYFVLHHRHTTIDVVDIVAEKVTSNLNLLYGSWGHTPPQTEKDHLKFTTWWQASILLKWEWEKPMEYNCRSMVPRGNWHVCMDLTYTIKPPCLVYSFGINNDWTFDDAVGALGCEVHSFDPSTGRQDFNRSKNVRFHNLGIAGYDSDTFEARKDVYVKNKQIWKIRRLKSIMERLGHVNASSSIFRKTIDVLKIDVETSEWSTAKDLVESGVLSNVRQFLIEWHLFFDYRGTDKYIELYNDYLKVKEQGFSICRVFLYRKIIKRNNVLF